MKIKVKYIKSEYLVDVSNGLSNCCYASPQGEVSNREARCGDCKEMARF